MIEFINVSKKYANGVIGLHNINIQIGSGEFLFIIGPSGAGKSSLLKMINRQEKATGGQLVVKGVDITQMSRFKVPQLRRQSQSAGHLFLSVQPLPCCRPVLREPERL